MYELLFDIVETLIKSYIFSTLAFLMLRPWFAPAKSRTGGFLFLSNTGALVAAVGYLTSMLLSPGYGIWWNLSILLTLLAASALLIFFRSRRVGLKLWMTWVAVALLSLLFVHFQWLIIVLTSAFRDYIPSTWSTYYENNQLVWTALASVVYFLLCWTVGSSVKKEF